MHEVDIVDKDVTCMWRYRCTSIYLFIRLMINCNLLLTFTLGGQRGNMYMIDSTMSSAQSDQELATAVRGPKRRRKIYKRRSSSKGARKGFDRNVLN